MKARKPKKAKKITKTQKPKKYVMLKKEGVK